MTTPPAPPPGSDPYGWPQDVPPQHEGQGQVWSEQGQPPPDGYPPPGYPPQGYPGYYPDPMAPYGYDQYGRPYSDKQKLIAGLLQILVGGLGIGRFYTGHTGIGIAQIAVTFLTCGIGALWGFVDGILILVNGGTDAQGRPLREN
jgi:TM2 domain-containing membrane protein YozV